MAQKIKVGAVSYLNTKPLIYGFEQGMMNDRVELLFDYPSRIASKLINDEISIGLVPIATIPALKEYHIIAGHGIACDGEVASVCVFSEVPLEQVETILLDYQSRTSVALLRILLREHWKISPALVTGAGNYETAIGGTTAGLVIGDRALLQRKRSAYIYDLGLAWKEMTGLPFVFAAWIGNKPMDEQFCRDFERATKAGVRDIGKVLAGLSCDYFDLRDYYTKFIRFYLGQKESEAINLFLHKLNSY